MINDPPRVMRKRAPARARCSTIPAGVLTSGFRVIGLPISLLCSAKAFLAKSFFVGLSFSAVDFFAFVRVGLPISLLCSAKAFLAKSFFVGLSFSAVDFFAFVRAGAGSIGLAFARAAGAGSIGLAFARAVLAAAFGFCFSAFPFRFLAHRAFAAALIFALATAESVRRFCGVATSTAGFADDRPIIAASWARLACNSAICASKPSRARRSNSAGSVLFVGIDQTSDMMLVTIDPNIECRPMTFLKTRRAAL